MHEKEVQTAPVGSAHPHPNGVAAALPVHRAVTCKLSLASYREKSAVQFPTKEALRAALRLFWHDEAFFGVPRYYVGNWTIVVPATIVDALRAKGLSFTVQKVAMPGQVSAEIMNKLRAGQGPR